MDWRTHEEARQRSNHTARPRRLARPALISSCCEFRAAVIQEKCPWPRLRRRKSPSTETAWPQVGIRSSGRRGDGLLRQESYAHAKLKTVQNCSMKPSFRNLRSAHGVVRE